MRFMQTAPDGGKDSGVTGFFIIEIKSLFSIVLLKFLPNQRDNYHSHAFHALTWFIKGLGYEDRIDRSYIRVLCPSLRPKYTPRKNTHKVNVIDPLYAISFRGPWKDTWQEVRPDGSTITLTHGQKEVA